MRGAVNFRDFGGAPSRFGGSVRRDRLYRSGHLAKVSAQEIEHLQDFGFAVVVDLRYASERETDLSPWSGFSPPFVLTHNAIRSRQAPHLELLKWVRAGGASMKDRAISFYRTMPSDPHYKPLFGAALAHLAGTDGRTLIHCTAGKDRTGFLSALILHALGVPMDDIMADYLRSRNAPGLAEMAGITAENIAPELGVEQAAALVKQMYSVDEDYLLAAFETIERDSGSADAYLLSLGLDDKRAQDLRTRLIISE